LHHEISKQTVSGLCQQSQKQGLPLESALESKAMGAHVVVPQEVPSKCLGLGKMEWPGQATVQTQKVKCLVSF